MSRQPDLDRICSRLMIAIMNQSIEEPPVILKEEPGITKKRWKKILQEELGLEPPESGG